MKRFRRIEGFVQVGDVLRFVRLDADNIMPSVLRALLCHILALCIVRDTNDDRIFSDPNFAIAAVLLSVLTELHENPLEYMRRPTNRQPCVGAETVFFI